MKKLSKFGRSTLSLLLCLTMLLTTFCFFDIGSVISEAIISKGDHALTEAGTTSNTFAEYSINLPELVYIKPGGKDSQYFLNSSTDGSVSEPTSSTSVLSFACSTARSVTFSVALYDSTLSSTVSSNRITNIAFADGTYMSSDKSLSVPASSVNKTIKSVTLASAETAKEYIIQWTIVYTTASGSYTTYAYTGVKFPSLAQAGMTTRGYYYGTTGGATGNPAEQSAYSFLTGVDSVAGGNVGSKFMSTGSSLTAPLVSFNSSIYPKSLSAPINSTYFDPDGEGVLVAYAEHNNSPYFGQGSRIFHTVWDAPGDKSYIPKDMITNASYFGGAPSTTADSYGYAAANITIDTSRYTDFSQVPNFSAGFVEFDSDGGEDQNYLHVIRNCSYSGWDAASYFRNNRTDGLSAGSMNTQATIWCPDVDRSDESNDKVFVRGLYKLSGNIYNAKNNLTKSTSGGVSRTIASYNNGVYTTYMRFEYSLRWNPWIGSSEYSSHIAAVRLNATLVDRGSARTYYHRFLNSGVNTSASNWSTINGYLKEYAKSLCVSTSSAGSITDPTSAISTAQANLKTTMISSFASTFPVYFDVPEVIYLKPQSGTSEADFQYVLDQTVTLNSEDNTTSKAVNKGSKGISNGGNITFYYADAVNVKITQSGASSIGLSQSGTGINIKEIDKTYTCTAGTLMKASIISGKKFTYTSGYITWVATYLDAVDGHTKTITAKTYVYAPSTSVAAALGAGSYKNAWHSENHFTSTYWITGGHSVSNRTGTYADGANGKLTDTKTGGMYDPPLIDSTVTTGGNGGDTATSAYPDTVPSGSGTTYARVSGDQNNKNMNVYGGTLNLEVDTERFETFAQIPNLKIGYDVNHLANTNSNNDRWMHYDVDNTKTLTFDATSTGRKISRSLDGSIPTENKSYTMTAYANPNYSKNSSSKIPITNYIYFNVTLHNTSVLRKAIEKVQKQFANLGINGGDSMYSYYYSGEIYNTFVSKYKDAYLALTKVDGYYGSYTDQNKLNDLAYDLISALNSLINTDTSKNNLKINCTAREYNLGLEKLADGKFKIIEIHGAKQYSLTYNARDNVYFAPDSYTGFTYAGSYELTNTSITPSSYYGKVLASLPKFLSSSDYMSKAMSVSGTAATIATTTVQTTTVPKFDGNATSFEWVAAVKG